jgi:hypothetical protein
MSVIYNKFNLLQNIEFTTVIAFTVCFTTTLNYTRKTFMKQLTTVNVSNFFISD